MKSDRLHAFSLSTSVFTEELHNPCPEVTDIDLQPQTPTRSAATNTDPQQGGNPANGLPPALPTPPVFTS